LTQAAGWRIDLIQRMCGQCLCAFSAWPLPQRPLLLQDLCEEVGGCPGAVSCRAWAGSKVMGRGLSTMQICRSPTKALRTCTRIGSWVGWQVNPANPRGKPKGDAPKDEAKRFKTAQSLHANSCLKGQPGLGRRPCFEGCLLLCSGLWMGKGKVSLPLLLRVPRAATHAILRPKNKPATTW